MRNWGLGIRDWGNASSQSSLVIATSRHDTRQLDLPYPVILSGGRQPAVEGSPDGYTLLQLELAPCSAKILRLAPLAQDDSSETVSSLTRPEPKVGVSQLATSATGCFPLATGLHV
ncbi:MAG: hypothetical protein AAF170_04385 [Bacteroidota bacterium]